MLNLEQQRQRVGFCNSKQTLAGIGGKNAWISDIKNKKGISNSWFSSHTALYGSGVAFC